MNKTLRDKIIVLVINALAEWGVFKETTRGKNPMPDGSHITMKAVNKILKLLDKVREEERKKYKKLESIIRKNAYAVDDLLENQRKNYEKSNNDKKRLSI